MTKQLEALIAKIKKQTESFDTVVLKEDEAKALIAALELAQKQSDSWKRIAQTNISERENDIAALDAARRRIAALESSRKKLREAMAAIHNTIRLDGVNTSLGVILSAAKRAHEESATIAPVEASPLAVKLPEPSAWRRDSGLFGGFVVTVSGKVAEHWQNDNQSATPMYAHADVIEAIRAAGGTVEGE